MKVVIPKSRVAHLVFVPIKLEQAYHGGVGTTVEVGQDIRSALPASQKNDVLHFPIGF
jgi:hypothetical protein